MRNDYMLKVHKLSVDCHACVVKFIQALTEAVCPNLTEFWTSLLS